MSLYTEWLSTGCELQSAGSPAGKLHGDAACPATSASLAAAEAISPRVEQVPQSSLV